MSCPDCGGVLIDDGEVVCRSCGVVHERVNLNYGPERGIFTLQQMSRARTGPGRSVILHDGGLSTNIQIGPDSSGRGLDPEKRSEFFRLRRLDNRAKSDASKARNLTRTLPLIQGLTKRLNLPLNICELAVNRYRMLLDTEGGIRGLDVSEIIPATIYLACRERDMARMMNEIVEVSGVAKKPIARNYRMMLRRFGMRSPRSHTEPFISSGISKLKRSGLCEKLAIKIHEALHKTRLTMGRSAHGEAAAILYIACILCPNERLVQREIADTLRVTEVTLRNILRVILDNFVIEIKL